MASSTGCDPIEAPLMNPRDPCLKDAQVNAQIWKYEAGQIHPPCLVTERKVEQGRINVVWAITDPSTLSHDGVQGGAGKDQFGVGRRQILNYPSHFALLSFL
ncbi:hypothetical protein Cni_G09459 [Canna indica]|uniref:Uncharacterized protein n=1 Tax=Canna indica TaxID=4628 RepID=A0AAQ3K836_9LILI|nr:hypothetical protein Cni_G09459 [Canna indica]